MHNSSDYTGSALNESHIITERNNVKKQYDTGESVNVYRTIN